MIPEQALQQAAQYESAGKLAEAEQLYRNIISERPACHPAYHCLGLLAHKVDKAQLAIDLISHAILLDATVAIYHSNLCEILRRAGRLGEAVNAGEKATTLNPDNPEFMYNLGLAHADRQNWQAAIACYQSVIQLKADHGLACNNLGAALEKMGRADEALVYYAKAIQINPLHAEAQNNLGAIYSERGQLQEARAHFSAAIKAQNDFISPYYNLSTLKTFSINDPHLTGLKKLQRRVNDMPLQAQIQYYFALGKAFEDIAEYNSAFSAFQLGNQLKYSQIHYNETKAEKVATRVQALFPPGFMGAHPASECEDATPIFIVGMPRSGTTLIEQILASHADIHGAGELIYLHEIITSAQAGRDANHFFEACESDPAQLDVPAMAEGYLRKLRALDTKAIHITDKMPANFFYIGFIALMFPRAKIIHAMRDPMDSCFSCYSRLFNDTMDFAYNLQTLGHYYVRYIQLMQHWHRVLPQGKILDVHYEDIVTDLELQARRIVEYIGLPWDGNCLEFYNNKRQVKTASVAQVRKPIYTTSLARWQHFDTHLAPLLNIVTQYR